MKSLGYILITSGFLAGSYYSVLDTDLVTWTAVVPCFLIGLTGVALIQVAIHRQSSHTDTLRANIGKLEASLSRIVEKAKRLDAEKGSLSVYEVHHRIDDDFMEDLDIFVENRESIGHAFGLQSYADVMTHFATGERYLNRCWSASTDGYTDEVNSYLSRVSNQFGQALGLLRQHTGRGGGEPS